MILNDNKMFLFEFEALVVNLISFQDTRSFGGVLPRGHGNDGLLSDLKRLLDEARDLDEEIHVLPESTPVTSFAKRTNRPFKKKKQRKLLTPVPTRPSPKAEKFLLPGMLSRR